MVVELFPQNEILKKHIVSFQIIPATTDFPVSYLAFPQHGSSISMNAKAVKKREDDHLIFSPDPNARCSAEVLGKYISPIRISYEGYVPEFVINFTSLGINYFFKKPYALIAPQIFQEVDSTDWNTITKNIFSTDITEEQQNLIEDFLLSQYVARPQLEKLEKAVELLHDLEADHSIKEICEQVAIHSKTLNRNFQKYAGCSPIQLKRIFRLRASIKNYRLSEEANLTQVAHDSLFYDSAHFIKEYHQLTGESPKDFFQKVTFQKKYRFPYKFL